MRAATVEGVSFQPKDIPTGPVAFQVGSGDLIPGLDAALVGTRAGEKLRVLVKPENGYLSPQSEPRPPTWSVKRQLQQHAQEPLLFEILVRRIS